MRKYNPQTHSCSKCGILTTKEAFKHHPEKVCEVVRFKNQMLKKEIENHRKFNNEGEGI